MQEDSHEPAQHASLLGHVLYADAKEFASEADWIRLVSSIGQGDQSSLEALYQRMHGIVFTLSFRIHGKREIAEEVTLDVFHDVWRRAASYEPDRGSVVAWIMNLTRSRAIDRLRFEQRRKRVRDPSPIPVEEIAQDDARDSLLLQEHGRRLRNAVARLDPPEREAIETAFFSGLTYAETAARLNQPVGTVKTRIRSALERLRHSLREGAS
jgi:RNA polymerase sigma-70 factor, ECF subfamily